jgi:phosphoribosylformimino-5-aminoimidazole carboxamide ribotide isomerase
MKAIPAIDLREGACVQLVGGSYEAEQVRLPDPMDAARRWSEAGFSTFHVVDLDAATGRGSNATVIERLAPGRELQVGGGVRDEAAVERLLSLGVRRVIVGTRAIEDRTWLTTMATRFPGRLMVAADVNGRLIVTRGWTERTTLEIGEFLTEIRTLPLAGVLVTAVHVEGQMKGTDAALFESVVASSPFPVTASGGITTSDDLRSLARLGCHAAVIGMALYTGRLDAKATAQEFST